MLAMQLNVSKICCRQQLSAICIVLSCNHSVIRDWQCKWQVMRSCLHAGQDSLRTAVADAAEGIPEIAQGKGVVALKHEIERLRERCLEQLQRQRFLENQRVELHPQE